MFRKNFLPAAFTCLSLAAPACSHIDGAKSATMRPQTRGSKSADGAATFAKQVRQRYPFHHQGVFVSETGPNEALILVTEPPPASELGQMSAALEARAYEIFEHSVGADGWVRDASFVVEHEGDADLADRLARLAKQIYGTSYGFAPSSLRAPAATRELSLDLGVSTLAATLNTEQYERDGASHGIELLLEDPLPGLAQGQETVALVLPDQFDLCELSVELRKFALDTDLVLGAAKVDGANAIIGRRRRVSPDLLPPLRVETLLRLAEPDYQEVAQSFERNNFGAGRIPSTELDWAPIYLSNNVLDTDFGGVLNISDQMLKSWSMGGVVEYRNFDYAMPGQGPFPDQKLGELLGSGNILFNWNTAGASMLALGTNGVALLAPSRGGALPMQYNPDQGNSTSAEVEQRAHDYFAGLDLPELATVVQYTTFNQALQLSDARASCVVPVSIDTTLMLVEAAELVLGDLAAGRYDFEVGLSQYMTNERLLEMLREEFVERNIDVADKTDEELMLRILRAMVGKLHGMLKDLEDGQIHDLAVLLAGSRLPEEASPEALLVFARLQEQESLITTLSYALDVSTLADRHQRSNRASTNPWIKTARTVYSRDTTDVDWIGGHNIEPTPDRVVVLDPYQTRGKLGHSLAEPNFVHVHPADFPKLETLSKQLQLSNLDAAGKAELEAALTRAQPAAPGRLSTDPRPPRRETIIEHRNDTELGLAKSPGWSDAPPRPPLPTDVELALVDANRGGRAGLYLELEGSTYEATMLTPQGAPRYLRSGSTEGLLDALETELASGGRGMDIYFGKGFDHNKVSAMQKTLELHRLRSSVRSDQTATLAQVTLESQPLLAGRGSSRLSFGRQELPLQITFNGAGDTHMLSLTLRSPGRLANIKQLFERLMPKDAVGKSVDAVLDELELAAQAEGISVDVEVLLDKTIVEVTPGEQRSASI